MLTSSDSEMQNDTSSENVNKNDNNRKNNIDNEHAMLLSSDNGGCDKNGNEPSSVITAQSMLLSSDNNDDKGSSSVAQSMLQMSGGTTTGEGNNTSLHNNFQNTEEEHLKQTDGINIDNTNKRILVKEVGPPTLYHQQQFNPSVSKKINEGDSASFMNEATIRYLQAEELGNNTSLHNSFQNTEEEHLKQTDGINIDNTNKRILVKEEVGPPALYHQQQFNPSVSKKIKLLHRQNDPNSKLGSSYPFPGLKIVSSEDNPPKLLSYRKKFESIVAYVQSKYPFLNECERHRVCKEMFSDCLHSNQIDIVKEGEGWSGGYNISGKRRGDMGNGVSNLLSQGFLRL